jgi:hypothetical protein
MRKRLSQVEVGKTSVTSRGVDKETCFYEDYGIKKLVDTAQGTLSSLSHYWGSMVWYVNSGTTLTTQLIIHDPKTLPTNKAQ